MRLFGLLLLLAGLACGYFASLGVLRFHEGAQSAFPDFYSSEDIPSASMANLSTLYELSKEQIEEVLNLGQEAIREAARRRNILVQSRDRVTMHHEAYEQLILQADQELDLLRLKDYYTQFYMHYFHWLDSGDAQSGVNSKLALGQFKATLDYIKDKYQEVPALSVQDDDALRRIIMIAEQTDRTIRWAKVVLVVLIFLLVMGIPRFIRDKGYKRFAASLYYDALFRPNMISDLSKWHSIKRMAAALLISYLFVLVLFSSFVSWIFPLVFGFLGLLPVLMFILMTGNYRRIPEMLVSFMAPKMLVLIPALLIVALRGPGLFWHLVWGSDLYRGIIISLVIMLVFRKFYVNLILVRKWSHRNSRGSASMVCLALGLQLLIAGTAMHGFGPELSMHALNRELLLLPEKLLGTPSMLLGWVMIIASVLTISALVVFFLNRRKLHLATGST